MYTTYHLSSADELSTDLLDAIKAAFKSKPITITVEEEPDATAYLVRSPANKAFLDKSIGQLETGDTIFIKQEEL